MSEKNLTIEKVQIGRACTNSNGITIPSDVIKEAIKKLDGKPLNLHANFSRHKVVGCISNISFLESKIYADVELFTKIFPNLTFDEKVVRCCYKTINKEGKVLKDIELHSCGLIDKSEDAEDV